MAVEPDMIDLSIEAEKTYRQVKALNRQLAVSRSAAERKRLRSLIEDAKRDWSRRVKPALDARKVEVWRWHDEAMAYALTPEGRLAENWRHRHG
jgi:hypothetical protein